MSTAEWLRHKAEYTGSLGMSTVRTEFEAGNLPGVLYALARIAEREARRDGYHEYVERRATTD